MIDLQVVYEDNHLIAVIKRAGYTVQPEPGKPTSLEEQVKAYIKIKYNKPGAVFLGVIHRLDMPVCGLVLFARTSKALQRMNEIFKERKIEKQYLARVNPIPALSNAIIEHWLVVNEQRKLSKVFKKPVPEAVKASLSYEIKSTKGNEALLNIKLHTGRKHQIRAQLAAIGSPIVGDIKYGSSKALTDGSIALMCNYLAFEHPVTKIKTTIQAPDILI